MKTICRYTLALTIFTFSVIILVQAQTEVSHYIPGSTAESVTYYLPRTALRLTVVADKIITTPGQLAKYAQHYLRLNDVPRENTTRWILRDVSLSTYGVPDPENAYSILFKKKTVAPLVSLTRDGILIGINTTGSEDSQPEVPKTTQPTRHLNPRDYMNQDILAAGSNAKIAELTAEEIYDIRESRNALIKGEADNMPKDGEQLRLMLNELSTAETALLQLFKGVCDTLTEVFTIELTPMEYIDNMVLFRFSEKLGVLDNDDLGGDPVYLKMKEQNTLPPIPSEVALKKKNKQEDGIFYVVPSRVLITISTIDHEIVRTEIPMAQFGSVETLGNALFDKKVTTTATFSSSTGAIIQISE